MFIFRNKGLTRRGIYQGGRERGSTSQRFDNIDDKLDDIISRVTTISNHITTFEAARQYELEAAIPVARPNWPPVAPRPSTPEEHPENHEVQLAQEGPDDGRGGVILNRLPFTPGNIVIVLLVVFSLLGLLLLLSWE
ncbi:hypothetical protein B0T21DRAFT_345396 [Apiosordaria backusii]|uniref:Uncharacterized protein n=1 Tax=Apiosordaria backusii TaxID=314023 RepID=A0AA40ETQ7_9PEZI|nr:hypothetical protein B0T21DRAFT_345396 [Apiosordaria backusii]